MTARLEVWNRTNTAKISGGDLRLTDDGVEFAPESLDGTGEKLNEAGTGSVTIPRNHPAASTIEVGRIIRLYPTMTATTPLFAWFVDEITDVNLAAPDAPETFTASGRGLLGEWDRVTVDPWIKRDGGRPISIDRVFNYASPGLNLAGWNANIYNRPGVGTDFGKFPEAWPVSPAFNSWVWSDSASPSGPPWSLNEATGESLFVHNFTASGTIVIYMAGKRTWDLWLDGVQLENEPVDEFTLDGYEHTWKYVVNVSAGPHRFACRVKNAGLGLAGFIAACFEVSNGVLDEIIWSTAETVDDWYSKHQAKDSAGSGSFPGFTAPQIIDLLLEEAKDRGSLADWTTVTYGTHDEIEEFACRVGDTYLSVLESLAATYVDIRVEPQTLTLSIYPKGELGQVKSVNYETGEDVEYRSRTVTNDIVNYAKALYKNGHTFRQNASSQSTHGVKERTLSLPNLDLGAARRVLDATLGAYADPLVSTVVRVVQSSGKVAGVNFEVGDTIEVDGEPLRVVGITWGLLDDGTLDALLELETLLSRRRRERQLAIERQIARFEQPATASILSAGTQIPSGRVRTGSWTWSWSGDNEELGPGDDPNDPGQLGQPERPESTKRLYRLEVEINEEDLPDATGTSTFEFNRNGSLPSSPFSWGLFNLSLTTTAARASVDVSGFTTLSPNSRYGPRCVQARNHVGGRYTAYYAEPV